MDLLPARADLARRLGADAVCTSAAELEALVATQSAGRGADAVLIAADTQSNEPVELAAAVARDRAVVVALGVVGMSIPRRPYYEKELDFRISRSYGPGRYDPAYEEQGHDYPIGYVRWTEQRNMAAFVALLAEGKVSVQPLITHRFPIDEAPRAYDLISGKTGEPFLGVVLTYPGRPDLSRRVMLAPPPAAGSRAAPPTQHATRNTSDASRLTPHVSRIRLGLLGAGSFASSTLLPALKGVPGVELAGIASGGGLSASALGERFGFG